MTLGRQSLLNDSNHNVNETENENRLNQLVHSVRRRAPLDAVVLLERIAAEHRALSGRNLS